jgi:hypothetical protein
MTRASKANDLNPDGLDGARQKPERGFWPGGGLIEREAAQLLHQMKR